MLPKPRRATERADEEVVSAELLLELADDAEPMASQSVVMA